MLLLSWKKTEGKQIFHLLSSSKQQQHTHTHTYVLVELSYLSFAEEKTDFIKLIYYMAFQILGFFHVLRVWKTKSIEGRELRRRQQQQGSISFLMNRILIKLFFDCLSNTCFSYFHKAERSICSCVVKLSRL